MVGRLFRKLKNSIKIERFSNLSNVNLILRSSECCKNDNWSPDKLRVSKINFTKLYECCQR